MSEWEVLGDAIGEDLSKTRDLALLRREVYRLREVLALVIAERDRLRADLDAPAIETSNTDLKASLRRVIRERDACIAEAATLRVQLRGVRESMRAGSIAYGEVADLHERIGYDKAKAELEQQSDDNH